MMRIFFKTLFLLHAGDLPKSNIPKINIKKKKRLYKLVLKKEKTVIEWGMDTDNKFFKQGIKTYIFPIQ